MTFPHIRISGAAHERGRQYGEQAAERVHRSIAAYAVVFSHYAQWDWARVTQEARRFVPAIEDFAPAFLDEMRGIADGARVPFDDIVAINVRTEVMYAARARNAAAILPRTLECTAFAAVPADGRAVLVGQNWDWKTHAFGTAVVLECDPDDGPRYVTAVEAGLLAKTGLNEHGLGIVTNALATDRDRGEPGVPYHVLLRALLAAETPAAALAALQKSFRSSSAHYLIAHRDHLALGVEALPGTFADLHLAPPDERGILLHGNHLTHPRAQAVDVGLWLMPDSVFRLQSARRWLDQHDPYTAATYEAMFADHAGHPQGICCHPNPSAIPPEQDSTVLSVVMDLDALTLRIADGRPCEAAYRTVASADFLSRTD